MISERTILWYMAFWGFAMNFMQRMNLNIAIVDMVRHSTKFGNQTLRPELYANHSSLNSLTNINPNNVSYIIFLYNISACGNMSDKLTKLIMFNRTFPMSV